MGNRSQLAYLFTEGGENTLDAHIRGGKGLGLAELSRLGLNVPPGFTITTTVARAFAQEGRFPNRLNWHVERCLREIETKTGKLFGNAERPLLVSVRSGAAVSMPGMMDTVLNVGMNSTVHASLATSFGSEFADACRARLQSQLESAALSTTNGAIPEDPHEQMQLAFKGVVESWTSERACAYREAHGIPHWWGTAINVQSMVFGNLNDRSATGVVFSRDVRTGNRGLYGEFLPGAQGEDVVAGVRTPLPISKLREWNPALHTELVNVVAFLERHYDDIVDVEFTIEDGVLYILQCRKAKRSAQAAATFAVHQVWDDVWDRRKAVKQIPAEQLVELSNSSFEPIAFTRARQRRFFGRPSFFVGGLAASPGSVVGKAVFSSDRAKRLAKQGESVVLFRRDTSPNDLPGMLASVAVVTAVGGETSHAAVVARGIGRPAVVGCTRMSVGRAHARALLSFIREGDVVSVSGDTGTVIIGEVPLVGAMTTREVGNFLRWSKRFGWGSYPQPRLNLTLAKTRQSANELLNDFYLTSAMAKMARGTILENVAESLRIRVHTDVAETMACYLFTAVVGETRHALSSSSGESAAVKRLMNEYSFKFGQGRSSSYEYAVSVFTSKPLQRQIEFVRLALDIFKRRSWSSAFGGEKWATIARALLEFLSGRVGHTVFVDHAFDLQHNGGTMFDKHAMLSLRTDEYVLRRQLDCKKAAQVPELYEKLRRIQNTFSSPVIELWDEGKKRNLW